MISGALVRRATGDATGAARRSASADGDAGGAAKAVGTAFQEAPEISAPPPPLKWLTAQGGRRRNGGETAVFDL